ncbi:MULTISPECIES: SagB family peptide dehydrogenase [unclassified Streptomyces]|uniref:SagB/ThcOx family dehydrogenase n=1 Tax=unclassified Streptomyces TaxID=2593676 RepID=UPI001BE6422F|nr:MULTISPECIES: SagB family peptide dehydrogenase [unclassified Streptomyces]MBT2405455.1 SagB family peptide dehydrogenase [Streptomyces sp. ISL-21]MBT2608058.1 SagB family peptide dehydrogenase [Streptomyces sp. ISL-87]
MTTTDVTLHGPLTEATALRQGVLCENRDSTVLLSLRNQTGYRLRGVTPGILGVLERLARHAVPTDQLAAGLDTQEERQLTRVLERISPFLARSLMYRDVELMAVEATAPAEPYDVVAVPLDAPVRLSKFALLRRREGALVVETPLTAYRCVLRSAEAAAVASALGETATARELASGELPAEAVAAVLGHLVGAGFADLGSCRDGLAVFAADDDEVLRQWDFHDLYFHSRSRLGRTDEPYGGRFPYVGTIEPLPPVKPAPPGEPIPLFRPQLTDVLAKDPSLLAVMEGRQSIRSYGERPLDAQQLGEFLYRAARVRGTYGPRPDQKMPYAGSTRPYPCGGAAYELELYLTIRRCEGIEPGIYHYDAMDHCLRLVNADPGLRQNLLDVGSLSTGGEAVPDVLITMTSRFQRLSWKYQSIAYAVTLKHVGVLYQTLYLVATAMGLAACGLGSGNSELAERAFGLDPLKESAIGEFLLGSAPQTRPLEESARHAADWRPGNDPQWQQEVRHLLP